MQGKNHCNHIPFYASHEKTKFVMTKSVLFAYFLSLPLVMSWTMNDADFWLVEKKPTYTLFYRSSDTENKEEYIKLIDSGIRSVNSFFGTGFKNEFDVHIYPHRNLLDSTWSKDWKIKDFKSECWMVASGIATKIDMISPKNWDKESCEHTYSDSLNTQRLIIHELVHVYHGQFNISPDFSDVENIDWFVEGLATYVSGQCDQERIAKIRAAVLGNNVPDSLRKFWTGNLRYGLSGSMVMYIDYKYGKSMLISLLKYNKVSDILTVLNTTETEMIKGWKDYILSL